jgi:hypothetical protein
MAIRKSMPNRCEGRGLFEQSDAVWPGSLGWLFFWRSLPNALSAHGGTHTPSQKWFDDAVLFLRERYIYFTARVKPFAALCGSLGFVLSRQFYEMLHESCRYFDDEFDFLLNDPIVVLYIRVLIFAIVVD